MDAAGHLLSAARGLVTLAKQMGAENPEQARLVREEAKRILGALDKLRGILPVL